MSKQVNSCFGLGCFVSLVVIVMFPLLEKVCLVIGLRCLKVSFLVPGEHLLVEGITCGWKLKHFFAIILTNQALLEMFYINIYNYVHLVCAESGEIAIIILIV